MAVTERQGGETVEHPRERELRRWHLMHPIRWVPSGAKSLLDVGCNVGALLCHVHEFYPDVDLAGVEVNPVTLEDARRNVPRAELHHAGGQALPFADDRFDCVTSIEVLEHIPESDRSATLAEIGRVLRPGGRLVLRTPHAGAFAFLDPHNIRFRFPGLYGKVVGRGARDAGYDGWAHGVVWHHHFSRSELLDVAGPGWELEAIRRGGLLLAPLSEIGRWPFYRKGRGDHPICRALARVFDLDLSVDFGSASYDILLVLRKSAGVA